MAVKTKVTILVWKVPSQSSSVTPLTPLSAMTGSVADSFVKTRVSCQREGGGEEREMLRFSNSFFEGTFPPGHTLYDELVGREALGQAVLQLPKRNGHQCHR